VYRIYYTLINPEPTPPTPESIILQAVAQIQRMDRGDVSVIREGPMGP